MNFSIDCTERKSLSLQRVVPLLVLVKQWGDLGKDAFQHVDIVLLLLQGIQLGDERKAMSVCDMKQKLEDISPSFTVKFMKSLEEISKDLTLFMDLFDGLSDLFKPHDESTPAVLDADCKHSVLGVFVQRCVLEYKRLTFSQLVRLHTRLLSLLQTNLNAVDTNLQDEKYIHLTHQLRELDFSGVLDSLRVCHGLGDRDSLTQRRVMSGDHELGKEALQLTELHGRFGHKEEGVFALQEAIRLAQQHNNSLLLEHTLAWLHKLQPCSGEDTLLILNKYVKNAVDLKMPALGLWGRLQQAKTKLELSQEPKSVLDVVMTCEAELGSIQECSTEKRSLREQSAILSFMGATWDFYGGKLQGLLYSQLLCHLMSCDQPLSSMSNDDEEALALSLSMVARYLAEMGKFDDIEALVRSTKSRFTSKQSKKIMNQCLEEVLFDRSVLMEDFTKAQLHLRNIVTLDYNSAQYRSALLYKARGNLSKAIEVAREFLLSLDASTSEPTTNLRYKARCLILLAEVYSDLGFPAMALPHIMDCLSLCESNHLPTQQASLCLAQLQLQMGSPTDCLETVKGCMLQTQCKGSFEERGVACFLMAQAKLLISNDKRHGLSKEDALTITPVLSNVIQLFQKISAKAMTKKAMLLQVHLFSYFGFIEEKNSLLSQLKLL